MLGVAREGGMRFVAEGPPVAHIQPGKLSPPFASALLLGFRWRGGRRVVGGGGVASSEVAAGHGDGRGGGF